MFDETQFLLSQRNNPNSRVRSNGVRWWGYPSRTGETTCIVLHTTESNPGDGSARRVAGWQASTAPAPSSYHKLVDTGNIVQTVLDEQTAFHAVGFNSFSLGLSFSTRASLWGRNNRTDTAMLERGAWVAAQWCKKYDIPVTLITNSQGRRGVKGIITHAAVDPGRRSDPGPNFPMDRFLSMVKEYVDGKQEDEWEVFWMSLSDSEKEVLKDFISAIEEEGTNARSFVRQLLTFHREERGKLQEFIEAIDYMNSSPRGQGRALSALWREAGARGWLRDIEKFRENRNYQTEELEETS